MPDFNVRSDSVNVEQIMEQIRARIREKRGVDYTEQQIRELASVKLEKLLDPRGIRSDLLREFKAKQPQTFEPVKLPLYPFEDTTIYETHRGPLQAIRKLLNPLLKLFFNPNALIHALHSQTVINELIVERGNAIERQRREVDALYFEVIHNLVVELTRLGVETKNLTMRLESLTGRLEFNERRARALEGVVVYKPSESEQPRGRQGSDERVAAPRESQDAAPGPQVPPGPAPAAGPAKPGGVAEGPGQRSRRRRRRRGRRSGPPAAEVMGGAPGSPQTGPPDEGLSDDGVEVDEGSAEGPTGETAGTHAGAAESVTQALAPEAQPHERRPEEGPAAHADRPGPDEP